jgi:putative ABC transport system permease protein
LVLLIACVNVSHLLLARAERRQGEAALRVALGASRSRLLRSSALEAAWLASGAAVGGLVVGAGVLNIFGTLRPDRFLAPLASTRIDLTSFAAAAGFSILAVALAALLPAWRASSADPARSLAAAGRGRTPAGNGTASGTRLLIVTEIALTFVVVVSAALLGRNLTSVMRRDAGFATRHVTHIAFRFEGARYADIAERRLGLSEIVERAQSLPGVSAVSYGQGLAPTTGIGRDRLVAVGSGVELPDGDAALSYVGPDYFTTAGIRIAAGRGFEPEDEREGARVLAINRSTAERLFPGGPAVGQTVELVTVTDRRSPWTVVGVVEDIRARGLTSEADTLQIYFPFVFESQVPTLTLVARTEPRATDTTDFLTDLVRSVAGEHAVSRTVAIEELVSDSLVRPRFVATLFGSLSVLAIVLASVGVYGIVSYDVARRQRDVGIRLALGADRARVLAWLFSSCVKPIGVGLAAGLTVALLLTRYLQPLLDTGSPLDPVVFGSTLSLIAVVSGAAVVLPARRSSRLDPLDVIRAE